MSAPPKDFREARFLRLAVAAVWLLTGALVAHPEYRAIGAEYLSRLGLPPWLMHATCAFELGLGLFIAAKPMSRAVAALQLALVAGFTLILLTLDPSLLVHPLGLLTKNIPLLVALVLAARVEGRAWTPGERAFLRRGMAVIWITEGLFPKLLFLSAWEVAFAAKLGLPAYFIGVLGVVQLLSGVAVMLLKPGALLRALLTAQLAALLLLPLMVGIIEPRWWVHPFGPLIKNIPLLVGTMIVRRQCHPTSS